MRYLRICPLVIMIALSILGYEIIAGVPKVLAFAEEQMCKKELHKDSISGNMISENAVSENTVSENAITENDSEVSYIALEENLTVSGNVSDNKIEKLPTYKFTQVDENYFADALFIGDSRTVGLSEYSGMEQTTFYASTGLTVYKVFDTQYIPVPGSKEKMDLETALRQKQFGKIYFMIGINEMGTGTVDSFMAEYEAVIEHLRELQPDAIIYVQAIMRVTTERSEKGDYIHNQGIDERNERISQLADNQNIFYLDVNPQISDETGGMNQSYTFDGVHLKAEYIPVWTDYLASHAIVR